MFTDMENWAEIRRRVLVDGQSKRSVCREFDIHWDTLQKILDHPEPPGYRRAAPGPSPSSNPSCPSSIRSSRTTRRPPRSSGIPPAGSSSGSATSTATHGGLTIVKEAVAAWRLRPPRSSSRWPTAPARPRSTSARPRSSSMALPEIVLHKADYVPPSLLATRKRCRRKTGVLRDW